MAHSGMTVKEILNPEQLAQELQTAGTKLLVIDFFANWCGPCKAVAPAFSQLPAKYPSVTFLKIDVDRNEELAMQYGATSIPSFAFIRNGEALETVVGANMGKLEETIRKYQDTSIDQVPKEDLGEEFRGYTLLNSFISKAGCECLNESNAHNLDALLGGTYLESDADEQLIISLAFNQVVKLGAIRIQSATANAPKRVRLFINQTKTPDFEECTSKESTQEFDLSPETNGQLLALKFVKFQTVQNLVIFVQSNQDGAETTRIDKLHLFGVPQQTTNMGEFKRVAGKRGEVHG